MIIKKSDNIYLIERINNKTKKKQQILILGTAHVSKKSVDEVKENIDNFKPDVVALELCKNRYDKLVFKQQWLNKDLFDIIHNKEHLLFLLNIILSSYQKSIGEELGVMPGSEFLEANKIAKDRNIKVALVDRDINITMKRAFDKTPFFDKIKIIFALFASMFAKTIPKAEIIEALKKEDMLNKALEEFGRFSKSLKSVLLDERNIYIANKTLQLDENKILLVVGAGHLKEIAKIIDKQKEPIELNELEIAKKYNKNSNLIGWGILFLFIVLFVYAIFAKGIAIAGNMIFWWILATGGLSALGAIVGGASLLTILVSFLVAPFTAIHPLLAAGWFAGLVELKKNKPTVKDFFYLKEIKGFKDFKENKVLRILLIVSLVNLGASIGTLVAFPLLISYII